MPDPDWLPGLVRLADYGGDWTRYLEAVYGVFRRDFIETRPRFLGCSVACRRDPLEQGKEPGFWHCTSGGKDESKRIPEPRRMERIGWVRAVIDHANDPAVDRWEAMRGTDKRCCLWFREDFLVVLAERGRGPSGTRYWQFVTAYDTPEEHRKRRLRQERDAWRAKKANAAPGQGHGVGTPSTDGG